MRPEFEKLGLKVFEISTASHEGLKELNFALSALVHEMREEVANREQAEEEARVVIKPLETKGRRPRRADEGGSALEFTVERRELGNGEVFFEVRGVKPERWVMQTNFDNDEAVGYLADRLAKLGVEDELRRKVLTPATKCASVVVPVWSNSIGIRPSPLVPKCSTVQPRCPRQGSASRRAGPAHAPPLQRRTSCPIPRDDGRPCRRARRDDGRTQGRTLGRSFRGRRPP